MKYIPIIRHWLSILVGVVGFTSCEPPVFLDTGEIKGIDCSGAMHQGTLADGIPAIGVSSVVPYTGGNGDTHSGQVVASSGITGLTATLQAGLFTSGSGSLVYIITGTPSGVGKAIFSLNIGGKKCKMERTVTATPGLISSLICSSAIHAGTMVANTPASGVSSTVPYSGGNGGNYEGQVVTSTITGLTATLQAGTFQVGNGNLVYTITGTPGGSGSARFLLNIGGRSCTLERVVSVPVGTVNSLNCSDAANTGTLLSGTSANSVRSTIPYSGGNGGTHGGQTTTSTGITGLTATLQGGTFASGSGSLVYTITGIPSGVGIARFGLSIGGKSCSLERTVFASVGTINSLNCSNAIHAGNLVSGNAASNVSSAVPYSGGNGGAFSSQTTASTGVTGLTATLQGGTFANGSGSLVYTITGTPSGSGTASFGLNIGGQSCTLMRTVNSTSGNTLITMKNIPAGTFPMGCTSGDTECFSDERPVRNVTLSAFQMGETEVTQAQWQAVMGSNPSSFPGCATCPVEQVSWFDAVVFCNRLSEAQGLKPCYYSDAGFTQVYGKSGSSWTLPNAGTVVRDPSAKGYRLPTEAEWEYAARGGNNSHIYSGGNTVGNVAWYGANSSSKTQPVKGKQANGYGLYDMSGNVWEWCWDGYDSYPASAQTNPTGPTLASNRVNRGGSWSHDAQGCRTSLRNNSTPSNRFHNLGFRLAL